ncbi:MAG: hypothetical protein AB7T37_03120 [Dehalococcoidia bacterium]
MLWLRNDQLSVAVLDPRDAADHFRFGPRYCTGGYVFQVTDAAIGDLMSGPTYPESFNWFDGQGIPDSFNLGPLRTPEDGDRALIIGTGLCDLAEKRIVEHPDWAVDEDDRGTLRFDVQQSHRDWRFGLERTVSLAGRTVQSWTRLENRGRAAIPVRWFPHPFYPQPDSGELMKVNFDVSFPDGGAYELRESGWIARLGWPWSEGHYQPLDHAARERLVVQQRHSQLGIVTATFSYVPDFFPIWGNPHTFSWEPFLERTVAAGQALEWEIAYDF